MYTRFSYGFVSFGKIMGKVSRYQRHNDKMYSSFSEDFDTIRERMAKYIKV